MRAFGRGRRVSADTPLDGALQADVVQRLDSARPAHVQARIDRALRILAARRQAGGYELVELQLVVQVCAAGEHYARWRRDRDRVMQRASKGWGTGAWPERLRAEEVGVALLPYPAGKVGAALATAKLAYEPAFIHGPAPSAGAVTLLALQVPAAVAAHDTGPHRVRARTTGARGVRARTSAAPLAA